MTAERANPVGWFEIPVHDLERARRFYEAILGVELVVHHVGPLAMAWFPWRPEAPGATGSLVAGESYAPSSAGTIVYFSVDDIEGALARVARNGGRVILPKMSIGEYGFIAHFEDCEGNRIALHAAA